MKKMIRTYKELSRLKTFNDRYLYLRMTGKVGESTFGYDRYLNQILYKSRQWRNIRDQIIIRDGACDLGIKDCSIYGTIIIHHMNPLTVEDIESNTDFVLNPEFLICTSFNTHNAIHYGSEPPMQEIVERKKNDTCPWKG